MSRHALTPAWAVRDGFEVRYFDTEDEARAAMTEESELFENTPRCWQRAY